jgi:ArsR family transcriptional regulator, arsenate/arsenite/antimonite-responsive transcriptional repressor
MLKVLGEPTRLRIAMLLAHGELCVCDITDVLAVAQPTISRHVTIMKRVGLVEDRRSKKWVHYRLGTSEPGREIVASLERHLADAEPFVTDRRNLRDRLAGKRLEELSCE